jgi:outer membrane immunogenic protein
MPGAHFEHKFKEHFVMKLASPAAAALLALTTLGSAAYAQDIIATQNTPWKGFYAGGNIGGAWNHTCSSWEPGATILNSPDLANKFYNRDCPNNGNFIGGVDLGYNFQIDQWVWGIKVDYDAVGSKSKTVAYNYVAGPASPIPSGTYTASGKVSPNGIILLGPRVGYAFDQWLPYFRLGGAFVAGQHTSTLSYTSPGDEAPSSSFSGGKNFKSSGYNVGFGIDYDISGPWSFTAEYNYVNLGKGTNSTFACETAKGTVPPICANYANFSLDNIHNSFTMNMFRVGFHYAFAF